MRSTNPKSTGQSRYFIKYKEKQTDHDLVQVALYENLAAFLGGPPNSYHHSLYSKWSEHDWGMIITGNVQVSHTHLAVGRDVVVPHHISDDSLRPFKQWADAIHGGGHDSAASKGVLAVMQLSHAGRQSINFFGGRLLLQPPLAPSAIRVGAHYPEWLSFIMHRVSFRTPRPMSIADIDDVVEGFVRGAKLAHMSGFDGVQLHAAHGCKFLSL